MFYVGMKTLHFFLFFFFFFLGGGGGVPDMPYRFGYEATDWLRGTWSPLKKISHLESLLSYWMEPPFFRYLKVQRLALFSEHIPNMFLKRYVISTFCAVDRVDLV